jgi:GxxExxY protein
MATKAEYKHSELTEAIISAFYKVYNTLGYGFLEKVYRNALAYELRKRGYEVELETPINVYYEDVVVGEYYSDLWVNKTVIVELKAVSALAVEHEAQVINYLKATANEVGLVLNFGPRPQIKRKIYETARQANS